MHHTLPRPLDPGEAFFFMSDHIACMNFVVLAERNGHLDPSRIQGALDLIQQENLLLQARICCAEEAGLRFESAPGLPIELYCHQASADNWQSWIELELSRPFAEGTAPLMRCLYLEVAAPACCVLALTFHHAVADGRSGTELLRRTLSLLATDALPPSSGVAAALPAMINVMPTRFRWADQPDAAKLLRNTLIADYRRHGALPPVPWLDIGASERIPRLIRRSFAADVTRRLISQARAQGTSVHGVLCAAQLLAQLKLRPGDEPGAFFLSCPVDMRAHLEPVPPLVPTGLFVSIVSATFSVTPDTEVWQLAREVTQQTRLQLDRGEGHLFFNMFGLDGTPVLPDRIAPFQKKLMASMPNTMVSNVGAVATVADDPAVESISFALCPMPYQTLFTAASSYKDQLILNVGFDAAKLTEENARILIQGACDILAAAADVA